MTPLFDANAHPSVSGTILNKPASFSSLVERLKSAGFVGACAVGLPGSGDYEHKAFFSACEAYGERLVPVAAWSNVPAAKVEQEIMALKAFGYGAIKLHPRLCGLSVRDPDFARVLRAASAAQMVVFHCSYQFGDKSGLHPVDPLPPLIDAILAAPGLRLVLLHGGTVEILRYAEALRSVPDVLLDLSFTLNRYAGSSIDLDIAYLFKRFDQRLCLGTDFPEYVPAAVRDRFEVLASGLAEAKRANIAWRNITRMLGLEQRERLIQWT